MLQDSSKARPHPDVVTTRLDNGEMVLLHLGTRQYFSLNQTGSIVWQLLEQQSTMAAIRSALYDRFDVTPGEVSESVSELMGRLGSNSLVTFED
jgi:hypothetical protein